MVFPVPDGRTKTMGTGQALLCCKGVIDTPFAVINADDYYGKEGFKKCMISGRGTQLWMTAAFLHGRLYPRKYLSENAASHAASVR